MMIRPTVATRQAANFDKQIFVFGVEYPYHHLKQMTATSKFSRMTLMRRRITIVEDKLRRLVSESSHGIGDQVEVKWC